MQIVCPCCQGKGTVEKGPPVRLSRVQAKIYLAIRSAGPDGMPLSRVVTVAYEDRIDGGPLGAEGTVRTQICHINKQLAVVGERLRGGNGGYRLLRKT